VEGANLVVDGCMVSLGDNGWDKSYLPIVQRFVENLVLHCIRVVASFPIVEHHFDVLEIQTECDKFSLRYQQRPGCVLCGNVCVLKNKVLGNWFGVDKFQKTSRPVYSTNCRRKLVPVTDYFRPFDKCWPLH
jgi:hypothetical protein